MPYALTVCSPDQAPLPVGIHRLSKGVSTDRQDGSDVSTGVVPTIDGEHHTRGSFTLPLISLPSRAEPLVIIRESLRRELFSLLADIVVGGAHPACCAGVGRG